MSVSREIALLRPYLFLGFVTPFACSDNSIPTRADFGLQIYLITGVKHEPTRCFGLGTQHRFNEICNALHVRLMIKNVRNSYSKE